MTKEEIEKVVGKSAAIFKLVCGVGNNAAWLVMMEGLRPRPPLQGIPQESERRSFRSDGTSNEPSTTSMPMSAIVTTQTNRMFHVADMSDEVRRKYGDISDAEVLRVLEGCRRCRLAKTADHLAREQVPRESAPA